MICLQVFLALLESKIIINAKDKWPSKTLIMTNTELSGPLFASAMPEHLISYALKQNQAYSVPLNIL